MKRFVVAMFSLDRVINDSGARASLCTYKKEGRNQLKCTVSKQISSRQYGNISATFFATGCLWSFGTSILK
ncbi:hypothetical protein L6452_38259 [Arctium lappa]|uniref:Uncharacterized protein n=1 Tax=Arctium lappa TaxID=4217 RepID=A0ACB8Y5B4_ARCLA|nr:hypothetical protein L6452_38259 [Arctium lappa]